MDDDLAPIVDPVKTALSPKDVPLISLRIRVLVFISAWFTVLWFSLAPWFPLLHVRLVAVFFLSLIFLLHF